MEAESWGTYIYRTNQDQMIMPWGFLESEVRRFLANLGRDTWTPSQELREIIIFPPLQPGEAVQRSAAELRAAVPSFIDAVEAHQSTLSVFYGYVNPLLLPHDPTPNFGGSLSGLRLPDDPHYYSLVTDVGSLDLVRHDPATGRALSRRDIRSWDKVQATIGEIEICRQVFDLGPFLQALRQLQQFLEKTHSDTVQVTLEWASVL